MKKTLYTFLLFISVFMIKAQESPRPDFKNMSQQERREYIKSLSPEQRRKLMVIFQSLEYMLIKITSQQIIHQTIFRLRRNIICQFL